VATLAVGTGVGVGAYHAVDPAQRPTPAETAPTAAAKPRSASKPSAAHSSDSAPVAAPPVATAPPPAELSAASPDRASAVRANAPERPNVERERRASPAELAPAPDLPASPAAARLAEQQALLDQARTSLRRGDGAGALAIVAGHESLYPVTEFAEERGAIRILSLVMTGRNDEARSHAERFERRFPTSLFLPSIRRSLGDDPVRPSEPETRD
jgi:hypothetical protein